MIAMAAIPQTAAPFVLGRFGAPRPCPVLSTARLTLGPLTADDWPPYWHLMSSPRARYMGGPLPMNEAWGWFCSDVAGWQLGGAGAIAIRRGATTVGLLSLNDLPFFPEPELGWALFDGEDGRGYASEAAEAALAWLQAEHRPGSLVSYVDRENAASIALAARLGAMDDPNASRPHGESVVGTAVYRHWGTA